jgi:hypothetical protein
MNRGEQDALLGKYLDGLCAEADLRALVTLLEGSEEARRQLARLLYHEQGMAEAFSGRDREGAGFPVRRLWTRLVIPLAAASVVLAGVYGVITRQAGRQTAPSPGALLARVTAAAPDTGVERAGERIPAIPGMPLFADDAIVTAARNGKSGSEDRKTPGAPPSVAFATVSYPAERTEIRIFDRTTFRLLPETGGKRYRLERGEVEAEVAKQPVGLPMTIRTPHVEMEVVGTRFKAVAGGTTRLDVIQGRVKCRRLDVPLEMDVPAGGYALAGPGLTASGQAACRRPGEAIRRIEDHEGALNWQLYPEFSPLSFEHSGLRVHGGKAALRVGYQPKADDKWTYGQLIHDLTLRPGDQALRFFIYVESFEFPASWNIQFRQRDWTCWMIGEGFLSDLGKGWNQIELEFAKSPRNTYGGGTYRPGDVEKMIFSVCQRAAILVLDDFAVVGRAPEDRPKK